MVSKVAVKEIRINRGLEKAKVKGKARTKNDKDKAGHEEAKARTEKAWDAEARALETINRINHPHIIKCIAAIRRGDSRYFMFPWADGDNLRDFWEETEEQEPDQDILLQLLRQLRGLADALDRLHNFEDESSDPEGVVPDDLDIPAPDLQAEDETLEYTYGRSNSSIRHGDLKPENLLRFCNGQTGLGTLKIADMGLAKRHVVATQDRSSLTTTPYSTIRYEAPEARTALPGQGRSRLYDIWSMGCITFEFIIWILYGNKTLKEFYNDLEGGLKKDVEYYQLRETVSGKKAEVHPVVRRWMDDIKKMDPECSQESAINDLLDLTKTKLLVVKLPPNRASAMEGTGRSLPSPPLASDTDEQGVRATAKIFRNRLDTILNKAKNQPGYLLSGRARGNARPRANVATAFGSSLNPAAAERREGRPPAPMNVQLIGSTRVIDETFRVSLPLALRGKCFGFGFGNSPS